MSKSIQEELIGVLWIIAALIAFDSGHGVWGWLFAVKGAFDELDAIHTAYFACKGKAPAATGRG